MRTTKTFPETFSDMIIHDMRDSMTLNSYSEVEGYKCNTVQKVIKEWVCITTTSNAKSLDEKELGWYNWLGIAHFSQSNMK